MDSIVPDPDAGDSGMGISIDPEFRAQIPPLRPEEREQLEANILAHGCRDPLVVWSDPTPPEDFKCYGTEVGLARYRHCDIVPGSGIWLCRRCDYGVAPFMGPILLDGHNRYEICLKHGLEYDVEEVDLPSREAAADWIDANQLGRRNLNPDQYSLLRGRRYNRAKKAERGGGDRRSAGANQTHQNDGNGLTAKRLGDQHGVSQATIERDGQFAKAVDKLKEIDPEIESKVVSGKAPAKALIVEAAKQIGKAEASIPSLGSKKDREAAEVWEKAKDTAEAILGGRMGTVAQAKREVARAEKRADMEAKAAAIEAEPDGEKPSWEIIEGDCVEVLESIDEGSVRLIFADPPYNIGVDYGDHHDDDMESGDFMEWCETWMRACADALSPDGSMWVLINDEWADIFGCLLRDIGLHRRSWIKWYESFGVNNSNNFNRCSRHLFYVVKSRDRFVFNAEAVSRQSARQVLGDRRADPGGKIWDNVWGINPPIPRLVENAKERIPDFPTQLPLDLLLAVVGCSSDPGDLVLDPFNGSGTTGAAAIELGRRYVGIEKSGTFASIARLRLTAMKGDSLAAQE